jgi:tyrosine-protein kinase Etk/Wzc
MAEKDINQVQTTEEIDIKGIILRYLRYWYLFVIGVVLCFALAFLYLRYTTPQYPVSSTLLIKDDKKGPDLSGNAVFSDLEIFKSSNNINNEIQVLKSKSLMQRVLQELGLQASFFIEGDVKTTEVYGASLPIKLIIHELDSAAFNKWAVIHFKRRNQFELEAGQQRTVHQFGQEIRSSLGRFTVVAATSRAASVPPGHDKLKIKFHDTRQLGNYYSQKLQVATVNKEASVLSISLVDPVPEKGEDIINKLVEVYNKEAVEDKNQIAANTIEFIEDRLHFLTSELTDVEKNVEQYKKRNDLTDVSSEAQLYLKQASEYNNQLAEFEIQLDVLNATENYLKEQGGEFALVPGTLSVEDPVLLGLIAQFNELQLKRQRMLRTTRPNNPLVVSMEEQLANLRLNILENLQNIKKGLLITRQNLQASSSRFESRIQQVPSMERELLEISRQQGIKEGLYLYLLQKREEAALSLAATVSNSRVIDPAVAGRVPVQPKRQLVYLIALFMGMGLPLAFVYVKEMLNDKVQDRKEVERATTTPVLGEIARKHTGDTLVVTQDSKTPVAELFRLMRTNLQFATAGKENKVILVTSSMSGEGKTFFSINLAASLALVGKKAVILDFDFRKPRVAHHLGLGNEVGITNYLISEGLSEEEVLKPSRVFKDLYVVGSGPVPPNPAELMQLPKVGDLITSLKKQFDYIIIDTSPVGQVADALTLNPYVDSCLYLVRYNYTLKEQLGIIDDIYRNRKLKHPMLVLNDARKNNSYGYGYGYGEEKKGGWLGNFRKKVKS